MARSEEHKADLGLCQTLPSPYLCAHMIQPPASCWYPGTEAPRLQPSPKPAISHYLPHVRSKFRRTSACSCIACIESSCSLRGPHVCLCMCISMDCNHKSTCIWITGDVLWLPAPRKIEGSASNGGAGRHMPLNQRLVTLSHFGNI